MRQLTPRQDLQRYFFFLSFFLSAPFNGIFIQVGLIFQSARLQKCSHGTRAHAGGARAGAGLDEEVGSARAVRKIPSSDQERRCKEGKFFPLPPPIFLFSHFFFYHAGRNVRLRPEKSALRHFFPRCQERGLFPPPLLIFPPVRRCGVAEDAGNCDSSMRQKVTRPLLRTDRVCKLFSPPQALFALVLLSAVQASSGIFGE